MSQTIIGTRRHGAITRVTAAMFLLYFTSASVSAAPLTGMGPHVAVPDPNPPDPCSVLPVWADPASGVFTGTWTLPDVPLAWAGTFSGTGIHPPPPIANFGFQTYLFSSLPDAVLPIGTYFYLSDVDGGTGSGEQVTFRAFASDGSVLQEWFEVLSVAGNYTPAQLAARTPGWSWDVTPDTYVFDGSTVVGVGNPEVGVILKNILPIHRLEVFKNQSLGYNYYISAPCAVCCTVCDLEAFDQTVECDGAGNTAALDDWLNGQGGASACGGCPNVVWSNDFTGLVTGCGATGSATVTFTATDPCGHSFSTQATFTILDTADPVVTAVLIPATPLPAQSATSAASVCSAPTARQFRVECAIDDVCDGMPTLTAELVSTQTTVDTDGTCSEVVTEVSVACDQVIEIALLAPPCPADGPASARPTTSVNSAGVLVVYGESVVLEVRGEDSCGNVATGVFDPASEPSTLCDHVLADGTCCPAVGRPSDDCPAPCGPGGAPLSDGAMPSAMKSVVPESAGGGGKGR